MKYVEPEMSIINLEDVNTYMEIVSGGGNEWESDIVIPAITG